MKDYFCENGEKRSTSKQIFIGLIAFICSIAPSMSLGFSAIALPPLLSQNNPNRLDENQASWVASIVAIALPIGCLASGPLSDKFGRITALYSVSIISALGWSTIALAYHLDAHQYGVLLFGRFLTGMSTGLASMPPTFYMAEISSTKLRPMFTAGSACFFSLGVLIVYILGFIFKEDWGTISLITAVGSAISLILTMIFLPETPEWLVTKDRIKEARNNMTKIYGFKVCTEEINEEIKKLVENQTRSLKPNANNKQQRSLISSMEEQIKNFIKPTCWKPFLIITSYFFFSQFSGCFVVIFYAIDVVEEAGVKFDAYLAIILIGLDRFLSSIFVSFVSRKYGRRQLTIASGLGMFICMFMLATMLLFHSEGILTKQAMEPLQWLPIFLLLTYFFFCSIGFLTLPFAMNAELFPTNIRGTITGVTASLGYIFNFVIIKAYPTMASSMKNFGVFYFYGIVSILGTLFLYIFLPETRGRSLQEIEDYFTTKN